MKKRFKLHLSTTFMFGVGYDCGQEALIIVVAMFALEISFKKDIR